MLLEWALRLLHYRFLLDCNKPDIVNSTQSFHVPSLDPYKTIVVQKLVAWPTVHLVQLLLF